MAERKRVKFGNQIANKNDVVAAAHNVLREKLTCEDYKIEFTHGEMEVLIFSDPALQIFVSSLGNALGRKFVLAEGNLNDAPAS